MKEFLIKVLDSFTHKFEKNHIIGSSFYVYNVNTANENYFFEEFKKIFDFNKKTLFSNERFFIHDIISVNYKDVNIYNFKIINDDNDEFFILERNEFKLLIYANFEMYHHELKCIYLENIDSLLKDKYILPEFIGNYLSEVKKLGDILS